VIELALWVAAFLFLAWVSIAIFAVIFQLFVYVVFHFPKIDHVRRKK